MTEEKAGHYAKVLAQSIGITFYVVRSREGRFLAVQIPSEDCEILAQVAPPSSAHNTGHCGYEEAKHCLQLAQQTSSDQRRQS